MISAFDDVEPVARLDLPQLYDWLTLNKTQRHWTKQRTGITAWHTITQAQCVRQQMPRNLPPCFVESTFVFRVARRRDPMNFTATTKAVIDMLVKWGCWPDDNPTYVTELPPRLLVSTASQPGIIVSCYERPS